MTLLIAYLIMAHVGDFSTWEYVSVFGVWFAHLCVHSQ